MLKHLACIMDGNRRWAKKHGLFAWEGHKEGIEAAKRAIKFCLDQSIPYLSLYLFSIENLKRSETEQHYMFNVLPGQVADSLLRDLKKWNVKVRFIGNRPLFPHAIKPLIDRFEEETKNNTGLQLNMLFCYGGRQEIVDGVKKIAQKIKAGDITEDQITEELLEESLWMGEFPAPDMIVRTSGLSRISNFLIYQGAYSEWRVLDCLWPEIQEKHLLEVVDGFKHTQRNFGR
jgi:undecaprenyl diphosphate synthase